MEGIIGTIIGTVAGTLITASIMYWKYDRRLKKLEMAMGLTKGGKQKA